MSGRCQPKLQVGAIWLCRNDHAPPWVATVGGYGVASGPDLALTFAVATVRATAAAMTVNGSPVWSYEITLPPEAQSVGTARRFVRERLNLHDLPLLVDDVTLVASELATNALSHAGTPFTVTITAFAHDVVLEVRDGGASRPNRVDAGVDASVGRGMAIVDVVCRDWGVVVDGNAGKSVWASFEPL